METPKSKTCIGCGHPIPEGRLKALPNAKTCVSCSSAEKVAGYMSYDHKTAPELNIVSQESAKRIYELTHRQPFKKRGE